MRGGLWWKLRMWLADRLFGFANSVQPDYRFSHSYSKDGRVVSIWRQQVR